MVALEVFGLLVQALILRLVLTALPMPFLPKAIKPECPEKHDDQNYCQLSVAHRSRPSFWLRMDPVIPVSTVLAPRTIPVPEICSISI